MENKKPFPIISGQGSVLNINDIVCRSIIIAQFWKILRMKGIALFAERRFGKSSTIRKLVEETPNDFIAIYRQIESLNNIEDFVETIFTTAHEANLISKANQSKLREVWNTISELTPEILGIKLGHLQHKWQKKFTLLIGNILDNNPDKILVICLDEFSLMLDKMSPAEAASLIGFLRDLSHNKYSERLRFIYCGSVGIDLILEKIVREGQAIGDPLNHMEKIQLPPFDLDQHRYFSQCLELGYKISLTVECRDYIHSKSDGIPYFTEKLIDQIKSTQDITNEVIDNALDKIMNDQKDNANLRYFYDRIDRYYPNPNLASMILSVLSRVDSIPEKTLIKTIQQQYKVEESQIKETTDRLFRDGYFIREIQNGERLYSFQYYIIKTWWQINKA